MKLEAYKRGQGAFSVQVEEDGRTFVNGLAFPSPRDARARYGGRDPGHDEVQSCSASGRAHDRGTIEGTEVNEQLSRTKTTNQEAYMQEIERRRQNGELDTAIPTTTTIPPERAARENLSGPSALD